MWWIALPPGTSAFRPTNNGKCRGSAVWRCRCGWHSPCTLHGHEVMGMKPAYFAIGLSMLVGLGACAAPFSEEANDGTRDDGTHEEAVKSADQDAALDALRSRVQQDFASAPSLKGHEIVVIANRIQGGPQ